MLTILIKIKASKHIVSKKILLSILILLSCVVALPQAVSAHVLISDDTKSIGAVLHIMPDDDPVAEEQANLFFDVQTRVINKDTTTLTITNVATSKTSEVPIKVTANSVTANYVFPDQGMYNLSLTVNSDKSYTFSYSQRVSRGVTGNALDKPTHPIATIALVFSGTTFLFLLVIMFNHRKEMWRRSTF